MHFIPPSGKLSILFAFCWERIGNTLRRLTRNPIKNTNIHTPTDSVMITHATPTCIPTMQECPSLYGRCPLFPLPGCPWGGQMPEQCSAAQYCWGDSYFADFLCPLEPHGACPHTGSTCPAGPSPADRRRNCQANIIYDWQYNVSLIIALKSKKADWSPSEFEWLASDSIFRLFSRETLRCWFSSSFSLESYAGPKEGATFQSLQLGSAICAIGEFSVTRDIQ